MKTGAKRYEMAKAILRQANKDGLVWVRYYNTYALSHALKVGWNYGSNRSEDRDATIQTLRVRLERLTDYMNKSGSYDIFGFTK